jgi:glucokinase
VDDKNLQILQMPERLQGLERFNWSVELQRDITVINDAHSACLAEYESFYKDKIKNMILLTLGTGVGGGAILNGALYQGSLQRAGHFGHITVDHNGKRTMTNMPGSLEYSIGNFSVMERTHGRFASTQHLVNAYLEGDHLASYWWLSSLQKLAVGIASLLNAFSPELIVLGGGLTEAGEALFKPLEEFMALYEWRPGNHQVPIAKAQYGSYAGAMGAAYFVKNISKNKSTLQ